MPIFYNDMSCNVSLVTLDSHVPNPEVTIFNTDSCHVMKSCIAYSFSCVASRLLGLMST